MKRIAIFILIVLSLMGCTEVLPPAPVGALPTEQQLKWHEMEFYAFVHFNMNTFTNKEWGYGNESPALFNPTNLDCHQWAKVCKDAGLKGIILTAKHHDGFCLWPSEYTKHSVKYSPWENGQGDVVKELSEACKEYGLKMGLYLSPWDRNHPDYGKPEYITYYRNQLRELLSNYGDLFEVWFDGANGGTGWYGGADEERKIDNRTYYDWENTMKIVRELQPGACMFSDAGPDVRWVGNEQGWAGETNWCTLNREDFAPGVVSDLKFLQNGQEDGSHWVPAEVDVSIRPGWFYHTSEDDKVKPLDKLVDIYYNSVGRNASLLLNFPVDTSGQINPFDVKRVQQLSEVIKADFAENLVLGSQATTTNVRGKSAKYKAALAIDGNKETYWATDDGVTSATLTIDFGKPTSFNRFLVQEFIRLGQRVQKFSIEAEASEGWKEIASGTTIGYKRILRFPDVTTSKLRLNILAAKGSPMISEVGVYNAPTNFSASSAGNN
jgi:alpha-L-fucosidase